MKTAMRQLQLTVWAYHRVPDHRGFGEVGGDHPCPPGGGTAVPSQTGFDVKSLSQNQSMLVNVFVCENINEKLKMWIIDVVDDREWLHAGVPSPHMWLCN